MKASPITFRALKFLRVNVEANHQADEKSAPEFDFDGAMLAWSINHGKRDDSDVWWVAVGFSTANEDADADLQCPYHIDMQAVGEFTVSERIDADKREELVFENGAALVYGAIRDMVSSVTARSVLGPLMLPTPTFMGEFAARSNEADGEAATEQ